jgi:hypothetical protein
MIAIYEILGILAAICLLPSLYRGAVQDLKEFKFAEIHFDSLWVNAAIVLIIGMYIALLIDGLWLLAVEWLAFSVISALIFGFIGFRFGQGGDWRAMMWIAVIAPVMLVNVIIASAICGVVQAIYWLMRPDIDTPPMFRKIPFAVSICTGYVIALVWMIVTAVS